VTSEERKTFSGFPAVEFKSKSDQASFHALTVKAGHHFYCTVAVYKVRTNRECTKFVGSLKLINP